MNKSLKESLTKVPSHWKTVSRIYGEACEHWISQHYICPVCGKGRLEKLTANEKSIDHRCQRCKEPFQVKACKKSFKKRDGSIGFVGAEYKTTLESIGDTNPDWNLILVEYNKDSLQIKNVGLVLKEQITRENIIPRKPLSSKARRAGWQGCNFKFDGRIVNYGTEIASN